MNIISPKTIQFINHIHRNPIEKPSRTARLRPWYARNYPIFVSSRYLTSVFTLYNITHYVFKAWFITCEYTSPSDRPREKSSNRRLLCALYRRYIYRYITPVRTGSRAVYHTYPQIDTPTHEFDLPVNNTFERNSQGTRKLSYYTKKVLKNIPTHR